MDITVTVLTCMYVFDKGNTGQWIILRNSGDERQVVVTGDAIW